MKLLLLLLLSSFLVPGDPSVPMALPPSASEVFVEDGKALSILEVGEAWRRGPGYLEGSGDHNDLRAAATLGAGDFSIRIRVALNRFESSAASFFLSQDHFGFDGRKKQFYVQGSYFGRTRFVGEAEKWIEPGVPFDFEAARTGKRLVFRINGMEVCSETFHDGFVGGFGLRPWRGTLSVHDFSAQGRFVPPPELQTVYTAGEDDYLSYRIPSLLVTRKGTLLAFCEGRKAGQWPGGDTDLLVKRSADMGKTWSGPAVVWEDGTNICGSPCPVLDTSDGKIHLLMTWYPGRRFELDSEEDAEKLPYRILVTSSTDDGLTWSGPEEITGGVKRPEWSWYATGPGAGIRLERGEHPGRLVIPCCHKREGDAATYHSHIIYSDDLGETWRLGGFTQPGSFQSQVIERGDGTLLLNMRPVKEQEEPYRIIAASGNGGETWSKSVPDRVLIDPRCQASILRAESISGVERPVVVFSNAGNTRRRVGLTIRLSFDEGWSWPLSRVIRHGPSAYSCLARLGDGRLACLFETGEKEPYERIAFAILTFDGVVPPGEN